MLQAGLFISELLQDGITTNVTQNAPGYAVGWGALALINAGLAQSKNRSGLFYFFAFTAARPHRHLHHRYPAQTASRQRPDGLAEGP